MFVLRKMVQGQAYTVHLDARSETETEAELALFMRDPRASWVVVEFESTENQARDAYTLKLWDAEGCTVAIGKVTFP